MDKHREFEERVRMKAYPELRGRHPTRMLWIRNLIPCIQVWANEIHIGFWKNGGRHNPIMRRPYIKISRLPYRVSIARGPS